MLNKNSKMNTADAEQQMINVMMNAIKTIYSNRSSDEYKSHGDITATETYKDVELMLANLKTIKGFSQTDANNLITLFNTLHRPIFKKMVIEYIAEPNERNIIFTAVYTAGYRTLVGELSRIYASTEATDKGIVYKPDKISRKNTMNKFIVTFNDSLEKRIDDYIRTSSHVTQEGAVDTTLGILTSMGPHIKNVVTKIFSTIGSINPISLINTTIMSVYDKRVANFDKIVEIYNTTYDSYKEYMRLPEAQRKSKVESKYLKLIDKYNIKMQNIKASIDHYDQRSIELVKDQMKNVKTGSNTDEKNDSTLSNDTGFDF